MNAVTADSRRDSNAGTPPPFLVGETYLDREGEYVVLAVAGKRLTLQRPDGPVVEADTALKARIHRNMVAESRGRVRSRSAATLALRHGDGLAITVWLPIAVRSRLHPP